MAQRSEVLALLVKAETAQAKRDMNRMSDSVEDAGKTSEDAGAKMFAAFTKVGTVITAGTAAAAAFIFAMDQFAERASRVTNLSTAFGTLGARVNATADFLPKLQAATLGQVNALDLMQLANNAVILGVAKTEDQFAELAEVATALGRAVGLGPTQALESLTTGIGRQSRMMLDNLGIIVDVDQAYRDYATSIGVAVGELDELQRKQAFANSAMEQAKAAAEGLEPVVGTAAEDWRAWRIEVDNATNALLNFINTNVRIGRIGNFVFPIFGSQTNIQRGLARFDRLQNDPEFARLERLILEAEGKIQAAEFRIETLQRFVPGTRRTFLPDGSFNTEPIDESRGGLARGVSQDDPTLIDLDATQENFDAYVNQAKQAAGDRADAEFDASAERIAIETREANSRRAINSALTLQLIGNIGILFGQSKLAAIAMAIINTREGVTKAIARTGHFGVQAALALAAGLAQVAAIQRTDIGSSGGGGGSFSSGGAAASLGGGLSSSPPGGALAPVEVRVFIEGQGFIQDPTSFARQMADEIGRELGRAGVSLVGV